jgi:hypothetical protein
MIPYTDEEMSWVTTGKYKKSNTNRERRVKQEDSRLWSRAWGIKTTIEVDGREYVVPVQL